MDIAVTLVIQGLVFFGVAWIVMKFGWPHIIAAIEARQKKIADGLAAASQSQKDLDEAEKRSKEIIREARERAAQIVDLAGKRSNEIVEEAKGTASSEAQRLVQQAHLLAMKELSSTPSMSERLKKRQRLMSLIEEETARWPSTFHPTRKMSSQRRAIASPLLKAHWVLQD